MIENRAKPYIDTSAKPAGIFTKFGAPLAVYCRCRLAFVVAVSVPFSVAVEVLEKKDLSLAATLRAADADLSKQDLRLTGFFSKPKDRHMRK